MQIRSPAFADGSQIPVKYTGDGNDVSPPLEWSGVERPRLSKSSRYFVRTPTRPRRSRGSIGFCITSRPARALFLKASRIRRRSLAWKERIRGALARRSVIAALLHHAAKLTLFLRQAGAPLDNNLCERALKKAILHRKNALFYKTQNGARVGDLFMSLIYTCQLNQANPFNYLTQLQQHADRVAANPELWLPWNYRAALT